MFSSLLITSIRIACSVLIAGLVILLDISPLQAQDAVWKAEILDTESGLSNRFVQ